jgi:hypothetical protein
MFVLSSVSEGFATGRAPSQMSERFGSFTFKDGSEYRSQRCRKRANKKLAEMCIYKTQILPNLLVYYYRGPDKSLAQPRRKQATATEDVDVHISYL